MAPKASTAEGIVLSYVNKQNRPLNVQMVADALQIHGIKKAAVQKLLDILCDNGTISFKESGKQKIYLANQDQFEILSTKELDQMKKENDKLRQELAAKKTVISELETGLRFMGKNLTNAQIKEKVAKLTDEITTMQLKLSTLKAGTILVTLEEKKKVEESYKLNVDLWRKRKRIFRDLWDMITEAMPKNLSEFKDELGIELDDDAGVNLEDYCDLAVKKPRH